VIDVGVDQPPDSRIESIEICPTPRPHLVEVGLAVTTPALGKNGLEQVFGI
jgi:hypothetical protein